MSFASRCLAYALAALLVGSARFAHGPSGTLWPLFAGLVAAGLAVPGWMLWPSARTSGHTGIALAPAWVIVLWDAIALLSAGLAGLFLADGLAPLIAGQEALITDPAARFALAVMLPLGILALAGFVTLNAGRRISVSPTGLALIGSGGWRHGWDEIEALDLQSDYLPVGRVGAVIPREFRRNLALCLASGASAEIPEPPAKSTRRKLLRLIETHAPARLHPDLETVRKGWGV